MLSDYWQQKRAVVTGGSAGLGRALAATLAARGAQVVIAARTAESLERTARELGPAVHGVPCNVCDDAQVRDLVAAAAEQLGGIDIWINAAGKSARGALADTSMDQFRELLELNFLATARCALAALPQLVESRGHLVNIGSLASKFAPRWLGAYPSSKFPVAALSQQLRLEQNDAGLHVLLVCPGPIAREDAGQRYDSQAKGLPESARRPGGGARVKALDPFVLAERILQACVRRQPELILPAKAKWLAAISQLAPTWGDWLLKRQTKT
ncbi:MAG: SDR family NAD(P)-dependent oxidoreductase [Planctomycetales bacterium]|nr:SDR family NAD(P)-dependent oxidoreductase [Planctomycetales bacterium]